MKYKKKWIYYMYRWQDWWGTDQAAAAASLLNRPALRPRPAKLQTRRFNLLPVVVVYSVFRTEGKAARVRVVSVDGGVARRVGAGGGQGHDDGHHEWRGWRRESPLFAVARQAGGRADEAVDSCSAKNEELHFWPDCAENHRRHEISR